MNEIEIIEWIREDMCDGCKGVFWFHESRCYEKCEAFASAVLDLYFVGDGSWTGILEEI